MEEKDSHDAAGGRTRRAILRDGSAAAVAVAVFAAGPLGGAAATASAAVPFKSGHPSFLTPEEMDRLGALVDAFIPGPPVDTVDGALQAGCAQAIDALLGAFTYDPPRIYAGAPFSNRDGSKIDYFKRFLTLDHYETMAWKLRIEGSKGRKELEFNGPVEGWQDTYRQGLAALPSDFTTLPEPAREASLRESSNAAVQAMVDIAFPHTYQFMYGPPEYGGNRDLVGWHYTNWPGDMLPDGFTAAQVEAPGSLPVSAADREKLLAMLPIAPLAASPELGHGIMIRSGNSLAALRDELAPIIDYAEKGVSDVA